MKSSQIIKCEDEQIHLCGKIQSFGYLLIFNNDLKVIAISENCETLFQLPVGNILNKEISFLESYIPSINLQELNLSNLKDNEHNFEIKINEKNYFLKIFSLKEKIYIEIEVNDGSTVNLNVLQKIKNKIEVKSNIWQDLSENINSIIDFDRIMIYQFLEDSTGIVVAETNNGKLDSVLGFRYPEFDIPKQARELYLKNTSRQTPDIKAQPSPVIGIDKELLDLSKTHIRATSPAHLQYLENTGVRASASFSIIIDDKLWGLVCCQNLKPKHLNINKRMLCSLLTQCAANSFTVNNRDNSIQQNELVNKLIIELKEQLFYSDSLSNTLSNFAENFIEIMNAQGLIIKTPNSILKFGITPNEKEFIEIKNKIINQSNFSNIYTCDSFKNKNNETFPNFAGIACIQLDQKNEFAIYWFRKEIIKEEIWAGKPEKKLVSEKSSSLKYYSPRSNFNAWKQQVKGHSEHWSKTDVQYLEKILNIVQDSIIRKMNEINILNKKLEETNNTLVAFTHQIGHDIKNLLIAIKLNAEFLQKKDSIPSKALNKFSTDILSSVNLINNIINQTIESTDTKQSNLELKKINITGYINQIILENLEIYKIKKSNIVTGHLHPILGEQTLLYQLFMNLISNAIKFSSKKDSTNIEIFSEKKNNNIVYHIKDNGIGIPEDKRDLIYNIFYRLPNTIDFEGTGVGMSIVKRITEKLRAKINIESQVGVGTTFKISFPDE